MPVDQAPEDGQPQPRLEIVGLTEASLEGKGDAGAWERVGEYFLPPSDLSLSGSNNGSKGDGDGKNLTLLLSSVPVATCETTGSALRRGGRGGGCRTGKIKSATFCVDLLAGKAARLKVLYNPSVVKSEESSGAVEVPPADTDAKAALAFAEENSFPARHVLNELEVQVVDKWGNKLADSKLAGSASIRDSVTLSLPGGLLAEKAGDELREKVTRNFRGANNHWSLKFPKVLLRMDMGGADPDGSKWVEGLISCCIDGCELEPFRMLLKFYPPFLPRTNRTSLVPPLVLSGHAASLTPYRFYPSRHIAELRLRWLPRERGGAAGGAAGGAGAETLREVDAGEPAGRVAVELHDVSGANAVLEAATHPNASQALAESLSWQLLRPDGTPVTSLERVCVPPEGGAEPALFGDAGAHDAPAFEYEPGTPLREAGEYIVRAVYKEHRPLLCAALARGEEKLTGDLKLRVRPGVAARLCIRRVETADSNAQIVCGVAGREGMVNNAGDHMQRRIAHAVTLALLDTAGNPAKLPAGGVEIAIFLEDGDAPGEAAGCICVDHPFFFCTNDRRATELSDVQDHRNETKRRIEETQGLLESEETKKKDLRAQIKNIEDTYDTRKTELSEYLDAQTSRRIFHDDRKIDVEVKKELENCERDIKKWYCTDRAYRDATKWKLEEPHCVGIIGELIEVLEPRVAKQFVWRYRQLLLTAVFNLNNDEHGKNSFQKYVGMHELEAWNAAFQAYECERPSHNGILIKYKDRKYDWRNERLAINLFRFRDDELDRRLRPRMMQFFGNTVFLKENLRDAFKMQEDVRKERLPCPEIITADGERLWSDGRAGGKRNHVEKCDGMQLAERSPLSQKVAALEAFKHARERLATSTKDARELFDVFDEQINKLKPELEKLREKEKELENRDAEIRADWLGPRTPSRHSAGAGAGGGQILPELDLEALRPKTEPHFLDERRGSLQQRVAVVRMVGVAPPPPHPPNPPAAITLSTRLPLPRPSPARPDPYQRRSHAAGRRAAAGAGAAAAQAGQGRPRGALQGAVRSPPGLRRTARPLEIRRREDEGGGATTVGLPDPQSRRLLPARARVTSALQPQGGAGPADKWRPQPLFRSCNPYLDVP